MLRRPKLENVKQEMTRNKLNILALSEAGWKIQDFMSDEFILAGGKENQRDNGQ